MLRICLKPLLETDLEVITLSEPRVENKMGTMPVGKLLISMAVPMMISMLVQALYNIVDSMFVAKLSQDALTAVSLAFSMQNLMFAIAIGTGVITAVGQAAKIAGEAIVRHNSWMELII